MKSLVYMSAMSLLLSVLLFIPFCLSLDLDEKDRQLNEGDRLKEYHSRAYQWPLPEMNPNTPGWRKIYDRRMDQLNAVEDIGERYNGWIQTIGSGLVAPNFTEFGWGLTRAPQHVVDTLKAALHAGLPKARYEGDVEVIEGQNPPLFIPLPSNTTHWVLNELKEMHENWSGVPLVGSIAYGLRVYQDGASLLMHVDRPLTHIISCILHIDHSETSEPWPIVIEDFQGNTNEVVLESGDMLFYESSKCFHGRPRMLKGGWYSSIFVHYYPVGWDTESFDLESHYAVPPHWGDDAVSLENDEDKLIVVGTSIKEPNCEHNWCSLKNSVKWYGPAIEGQVITPKWSRETRSTHEDEL